MPAPKRFDPEQLPSLGWIQITDVGEENIYFDTIEGVKGYVKACEYAQPEPEPKPEPTTFHVVEYRHRHGDSIYPVYGENPTEESVIESLRAAGDWDDSDDSRDDSYVIVHGPFTTPTK